LTVADYKGISGNSWYKAAEVAIDLDSISDTNPANPILLLFDQVPVGNNQYFEFFLDNGGFSGVPITISNYKFDPATNTVSADYTVTSSATFNGKSAVVSGSFQFVGLTETVYRKAVK